MWFVIVLINERDDDDDDDYDDELNLWCCISLNYFVYGTLPKIACQWTEQMLN